MSSGISIVQSGLLCGISWCLWRVIRWTTAKSPLDNIPGPPSASIWSGNFKQFYARQGWEFHHDVTQNYGSVVRMTTLLGQPFIYVFDPKALHSIIIKDQQVYEGAQTIVRTNLTTLGPGLLATLGDRHRRQRKLLNPAFSINHMRYMLPIFYRVTHQLRQAITSHVNKGPRDIDVLNWLSRTALELIGQGGLGYSFDPLVSDEPDAFGDALKAYLPLVIDIAILRNLGNFLTTIGSPAFRRFILDRIPHKKLQALKEVVDVMAKKSTEIFNAKKDALKTGDEAVLRQLNEGKDIMSILIKANMEAGDDERLPDAELLAQMTTLTLAAMDTTSNTLARIFHILAINTDVQEKLRQEIIDACKGQDLPYNELMEIPYLDAVIRETLRVYAPVTILPREARKDIILPLSEPIRGLDGKLMHEIPIPKDTRLLIGIEGVNCNKALWGADALEWKPERWLSPLPAAVTDAHLPSVYSNMMTFTGGPRACIGFKFSELEMKTILCTLLPTFKFELADAPEPVVWNISGVNFPTMGSGRNPSMVLKVSSLN